MGGMLAPGTTARQWIGCEPLVSFVSAAKPLESLGLETRMSVSPNAIATPRYGDSSQVELLIESCRLNLSFRRPLPVR